MPCIFINTLKFTVEEVRGEAVEDLHRLRNTGGTSAWRRLSPLLPDQEFRAAALEMGETRWVCTDASVPGQPDTTEIYP